MKNIIGVLSLCAILTACANSHAGQGLHSFGDGMRHLHGAIGCAVSGNIPDCIGDDDLAKMTDNEICNEVKEYPSEQRFIVFMNARGLRCHPSQITCAKAGYKPDTKEYKACTARLMKQMMDDRAAKKSAPVVEAPRPSPYTSPPSYTCMQNGPFTNCNPN